MHKIITKRYIRDFVKKNIEDVPKETLQSILEKKNIPYKNDLKKQTLINIIDYHKIDLCFVYKESMGENFGITKEKLAELIECKEEFVQKLITDKVINKVYTKDGVDYYSLCDVYELSQEKLAKIKTKRSRISKSYKDEQKGKLKVVKSIEGRLGDVEENKRTWISLLNDEEYVILYLGATGGNVEVDEIVALSVMSLEGEVLFNKKFETTKKIGADGYHITKESSEEKRFEEYIEELEKVIDGRTIISYEIDFAEELLKNNGYKKEIKKYNLMKAYMEYIHSKYIIRFKRALNMQKLNSNERCSTLEDCQNTINLIKSVVKECDSKIEILEGNIKSLSR